jgi:integrase
MDNFKIKYNLLFFPDKEIDKDLTADKAHPIYKEDGKLRMRVRWEDGMVAFNVGYRVKLSQWDSSTQRCKAKTTNFKKQSASEINAEIQRLENIANSVFASFEVERIVPTPDDFRGAFNEMVGRSNRESEPEKPVGFLDRFDEFTREMGRRNQWTNATYEKFAAVRNHILHHKPNVTFDYFNEDGLNAYLNFLRDERKLRNSTLGKQLGFLKWFLRWAVSKGYNEEKAFQTFMPKFKTAEKKVVFLEWEELMTVYKHKIPKRLAYLDRVRDVFCFCCFTSLRYSDVANLKRSDVFDDYISITTVKTADSLKIELNDYSKAILDKYRGIEFEGDLALPVISNQKMNDYIKELGQLCKIDKPITVTYYKGNQRFEEVHPKYELLGTHSGRRTFICNALILGIAPHLVMKWTGHSDYKSMRPYIDVADAAEAEAMKLFNR